MFDGLDDRGLDRGSIHGMTLKSLPESVEFPKPDHNGIPTLHEKSGTTWNAGYAFGVKFSASPLMQ